MKQATTLLPKFALLALVVVLFTAASSLMFGQASYTWTGATDTSWQTSTNWSPTRSSPNIGDTLVFDGTQTNQPSDSLNLTVSRLLFTGYARIGMYNKVSANGKISCTGSDGFHINPGVTVYFSYRGTGTPIDSVVLTTGGGIVNGTLVMNGRTDIRCYNSSLKLVFNSGAICVDSLITGAIFGNAAASANCVEFKSGSQFWFYQSSNPQQLGAPASVVLFDHGSLWSSRSNSGPRFIGGVYGNFEYRNTVNKFINNTTSYNQLTCSINLTPASGDWTVDTLRIFQDTVHSVADTINFSSWTGRIIVNGNIELNPNTAFVLAPTAKVVFAGAGEQKVYGTGIGTITFSGGDTVRSGSTLHLVNTVSIPTTKVCLVAGTFNPDTASIIGAGSVSAASGGTLQAGASTFGTNYSHSGGTTLSSGSTVEYNGIGAQSVDNTLSYSNLRINNGATASLTGTTGVSSTLSLAAGTLSAGTNTLNLSGTGVVLSSTGGSFSPGTSTVNYTGSSPTTIGAVSYNNLNLNGATTYTMGGSFAAANVTVVSGATLNPGSLLTGSGTLTVDGTLNVKGTNFSDNYTGFSSYLFDPGSTVIYNGSGAQNIGSFTYDNLSLNNASGATQAGDIAVNNTLTLTSGTYNIGSTTLTISKAIAGTPGNLSSTSGSSLTIAGSGTGITVPSSISALSQMTMNNTNGATLGGPVTLTGDLVLTSGTLADGGNTITAKRNVLNSSAENGSGKILLTTSTGPAHALSGSGSYNNLELDDAAGATLTGSPTVNGSLALTSGACDNSGGTMNLGNGLTITRTTGTLSVAPAFGTSVNLDYLGSSSVSTGAELPSSATILNNVTINNSGGVNLSGNATVNGALTLTSGNFSIGANALTMKNAFAGTATNLLGGTTSSLVVAGSGSGITLPSNMSDLNNFTLDNANGASISANLTMTGVATVTSGQLATGANTLILGAAGSLAEAGSGNIVLGNVRATRSVSAMAPKAGVRKPFVNENFGGIGFEIDPNGGTLPGATTVNRVTGTSKTGGGTSGVKRFYDVSAATNTGLSATVVFHYDDAAAELTNNTAELLDENHFTLFRSPTGSAPWTNVGYTTRDAGANTLTLNGVTDLSTWTVSDTLHPLSTNSSLNSDVVVVPSSESATISSLVNDASPLTSSTGVQVWQVRVRDGGGAPDVDDHPTELVAMTVTQGAGNTVPNWSNAIKSADLFLGATHVESGTIGASSITFSTITGVTAPDNDSVTLSLRISLKDPLGSGVADHQNFVLEVTNANVTAGSSVSSSQFSSFTAAVSNYSSNVIQVLATNLFFTTEPPTTTTDFTNFLAIVSGVDVNHNLDSDYVGSVTLAAATGTGTLSAASTLTKTASSGRTSWSDLRYNKVESGIKIGASNGGNVPDTSTAINFTQRVDALSDVISNAGESATVSSVINNNSPLTSVQGVQVWSVTIRDGGAAGNDADDLPTILTGLTLTQNASNTVTNWSTAVNAADLFDGSTHLASGVIGTNSIAFTGFSASAADNGTKSLTVRFSVKNPLPASSDNTKFVFDVTATNVAAAGGATSSTFNTGASIASSDNSKNVLTIVATTFRFVTTIPNGPANTNFSATVNATDANGNLDGDFGSVVTLAVATGPGGTLTGNTTPTASGGTASSTNLQLNVGGTYSLSASSGILTPGTSNTFLIGSPGGSVFKVAGPMIVPGAFGPRTTLAVDTLDWDSPSTWTVVSGGSLIGVPHSKDTVILDNTFKSGSYVITVGKTVTDSARMLKVGYPHNPNKITLLIPNMGPSQVSPSIIWGDALAGDYDIDIDSGGVINNSIGAVNIFSNNFFFAGAADSIRIRKGGLFYENNLMNQTFFGKLTNALDGDYGTVEFDVPPFAGSFDINADNIWWPNLTLSNTHGANTTLPYFLFPGSTSGAMYIKGNLTVNAGARDSLGTSGDGILLYGNLINNGGTKFTNSPLVFAGTTTQIVSGNPVQFGFGFVTLNPAGETMMTNITVTGGVVQTSGTYDINTGGGVLNTVPTAGVVNLGSSSMTLNPNGSMNEGTNPVQGIVSATRTASQNVNQTFGNIGFEINAAGGAPGSTAITRKTGTASTGNGNQSILRYYDVNATNNTALNAAINVYYAPAELNGNTETDLLLHKSTNAGTTWSGKTGTVNTSLHKISATGVNTFTGNGNVSRWTAAAAAAPLFITHTITVRKFADTDGDILTVIDQTPKKWRLSLYSDSITAGTLVKSQNPNSGVMTALNLQAGKYIAVEEDSAGWLHIGKVRNGTPIAGGDRYDTVTVSGGTPAMIDFINQRVGLLVALKFKDTDGDPSTIEGAKIWFLSIYKGSISPANLVISGNASELDANNLQGGTYIIAEADSGSSWVRLNGNHTRFDTVVVTANSTVIDTLINFQPNTIVVNKYRDGDGQFGTSGDRTPKSWYLEIRKNSSGGAVVASGSTGSLTLSNAGDGTYYISEADSAGWLRLGQVVNGVPAGGSLDNQTVTVVAGQTATVSFVNAPPIYSQLFRSFRPDSIALDKDNFGKIGKFVKPKADKVDFLFRIHPPRNLADAQYQFSMNVTGVVTNQATGDTVSQGILSTPSKSWAPPSALDSTKTYLFRGRGDKGKLVKVTITWVQGSGGQSFKPIKIMVPDSSYAYNRPGLPMPNRVNALFETFSQGGFNATSGLPVGLVKTDNPKAFAWIIAPKYTDVLKTLSDKSGMHNLDNPKFLSYYDNTSPMKGVLKSLPPSKQNNGLVANLMTLKLNIAASQLGKTPPGYGELVYTGAPTAAESTAHFFMQGRMIKNIAVIADSVITGYYTFGAHLGNLQALPLINDIVKKLNNAFEGVLDTIDFSPKLHFKGTRALVDVPYLKAIPGMQPTILQESANPIAQIPNAYQLYQNYPNPFNPTTTISFDLPGQSLVTLKIYNMLGQEVTTLLDHQLMDDGTQELQFNASNLATGVYFYRIIAQGLDEDGLNTNGFTTVKKMLLVK